MGETEHVVRRLLDAAGQTYAEQAGVRLKNAPASAPRAGARDEKE